MRNFRLEIEQLILNTFLQQDKASDMDKVEIEDYKIDYKLFKSNKTNKLVAKAISNLQANKEPISEIMVEQYISKRTRLDVLQYLELTSKLWVTFDTMLKYMDKLKEINYEDFKEETLKAI